MTLTDSIDAALAAAEADQVQPFRIDLTYEQVDELKSGGLLGESVGPQNASPGAYKGVNVFPTRGVTELLAQPADALRAKHFSI